MKQKFMHTNDKGLTEVEYDVQIHTANLESGSKNPVQSIFLAESKKIKGRSTRSNKSKNSSPVYKPVQPKKLTDAEFLDLAIGGEERPAISINHKNWSADGFRMHVLEGAKEYTCKCQYCRNVKKNIIPMTPDYKQIVPTRFTGEFTLERDAILDAGNVCRVMAREGSNVIRMYISSDGIEFVSKSEEVGECKVSYEKETKINKNYTEKTYHYNKTGEDLLISFNVSFLLDAVKGMGEVITFKYSGATRPGLITDGKRTAVLMPMHLN